MSDLFGTRAPITSDIALVIQVVLLILLLAGLRLGKRKTANSLSKHGMLMKVMVLLNTGVLLLVMLPSFVIAFDFVLAEVATGVPLILVHHSLGLIAEVLGVTLIFRKFGDVRLWMRVTFSVWFVALLLGLTVYVVYWALPTPS